MAAEGSERLTEITVASIKAQISRSMQRVGLPEHLMEDEYQKMMLLMLFPAILEQHFGRRMGFMKQA